MGKDDITAHGFRSAFSDWATEGGQFDSELVERALAHVEKDKVRRAYVRGDLLDRRRELMNAWSAFVITKPQGVETESE